MNIINSIITEFNRITGVSIKTDSSEVEFLDTLQDMEPIANISEDMNAQKKASATIQEEILAINEKLEGLKPSDNTEINKQISDLATKLESAITTINQNFTAVNEEINKVKAAQPTKILDTTEVTTEINKKEEKEKSNIVNDVIQMGFTSKKR